MITESVYLKEVTGRVCGVCAPHSPALRSGLMRLVKKPGKLLRPRLVFMAADGIGEVSQLIAVGAAIELLHLGSMVHDDIIDGTHSRRAQPTVVAKEGASQAIVAGDYLIACACSQAGELTPEIAMLIPRTLQKLCEGESLELLDMHNSHRSVENYFAAIKGKTASLFAAACQAGGLVAGRSSSEVAALGRFGEHFGVLFQIVDDVLDFISTPALLGKPIGQDLHEGNYTLPALYVRNRFGLKTSDFQNLRELLWYDGAFERAIQTAQNEADCAAVLAREYGFNPRLAAWPDAFLHQSLDRYIDQKYRNSFKP